MDEIQDVILRDLKVSSKRGAFSTPREIMQHINSQLNSDFSVKRIAMSLKEVGWTPCGKNRARRNGSPCGFYYKSSTKRKALISAESKRKQSKRNQRQRQSDASSDESLVAIDKRYKIARANKEEHLAAIREAETETARTKAQNERIELAKKQGEYVLAADVKRDWLEALNTLKIALYHLPENLAARWASIHDEKIIHDEFVGELDSICRQLAERGEKAVDPTETEINEVDE